GKYGEEVRRYAQQTIEEEGQGAGTDEALERARVELALEEEEKRRRGKIGGQGGAYEAHEGSPPEASGGSDLARPRDRCSRKQAWLIHKRFGWSLAKAQSLTPRQASAIITKLLAREAKREMGDLA